MALDIARGKFEVCPSLAPTVPGDSFTIENRLCSDADDPGVPGNAKEGDFVVAYERPYYVRKLEAYVTADR